MAQNDPTSRHIDIRLEHNFILFMAMSMEYAVRIKFLLWHIA